MPKMIPMTAALLFGAAALVTSAAAAQDADRALLATFCDAANIKGAICMRAKNYPEAGKRNCDVKLSPARYSGKFAGGGRTLLVVSYQSGCEPHAENFGGAVLFEQTGGKPVFSRFLPGSQTNDCVVLPRGAQRDILVCLTGFMGQGVIEGGVAQMVFTHEYDGRIKITHDFLMTTEDTTSAWGANVVTCKEPPPKYFGVSKLSAGPGPNAVTVTLAYAGAATMRTACGAGFPKPKETYGDLAPGDAYVPEGSEESGRFVIDLETRQVLPQ